MHVFLYQFLRLCEALGLEAIVRVKCHGWLDPELGLAFGMLHMHVRPRLFARKELESEPLDAEDRRTHAAGTAQPASWLASTGKGDMSGATNEVALLKQDCGSENQS